MSQEAIVKELLNGIEFDDSRLYDLLNALTSDFYKVQNELHPPTSKTFGFTGQVEITNNVDGFTVSITSAATPNVIRLSWNSIDGITTYELRYQPSSSTDWDSATILLKTAATVANIDPSTIPAIYGTYTFLLKAININGVYSNDAATATLVITQIPAPEVSATVIDNNVLLNWTTPISQFHVDYYNVYKNDILDGVMDGNFEAIFETASGTYKYSVEAVDIVGNKGTKGDLTADVKQPPDFILQSTLNGDLNGTKVNCIKETIPFDHLVACVTTGRTWAQHFTDHSWTTIQAQLNAGYPLYCEPAETTASYEEIFDFGAVFSNVIVSVKYNTTLIAGTVSLVVKIATSDDGISYSAFTTSTGLFSPHLRYAKIRIEFTGSNDKSIIWFYNLSITLNVKEETESGTITANSGDSGGTTVNFVKEFKDVNSITLTCFSLEPVICIYDFVDAPNPTSFKILAFSSTGNRITKDVSYKVRGIV